MRWSREKARALTRSLIALALTHKGELSDSLTQQSPAELLVQKRSWLGFRLVTNIPNFSTIMHSSCCYYKSFKALWPK